jgi:hypothetical protein
VRGVRKYEDLIKEERLNSKLGVLMILETLAALVLDHVGFIKMSPSVTLAAAFVFSLGWYNINIAYDKAQLRREIELRYLTREVRA